jgi:hypothetical protein
MLTRPARQLRAAAVLAAVAVAVAVPAAGAAPAGPTGSGTAATTLTFPSLDLVLDAAGSTGGALGTLSALADTTGTAYGALALADGRVGQLVQPEQRVDSRDGGARDELGVALPNGPVTGAVQLAGVEVSATATDAVARLSALDGELAAPLGLSIGLSGSDVVSRVTPTASHSGLSLSSPGLSVELSDVLPADVLAALPLSVVLDLTEALDLPAPDELLERLRSVTDVAALLEQLRAAEASLEDLRRQLGDLTDDPALAAEIDAAEQAVADAAAALSSALSELSATQAGLTNAKTDATAAQTAVVSAETELTAAQTVLATESAELAALEEQLADARAELAYLESLTVLTPEQTLRLLELPGIIADLEDAVEQAEENVAAATAAAAASAAALADAEAALAAAEAAVAALEESVALDEGAVDAARTLLAAAYDALEALLAQLPSSELIDALRAEISRLVTVVDGVLLQIERLLADLPDVSKLRLDLLAGLADVPLLATGLLVIDLASTATGEGGDASAACTVADVTVLGQPVPGATCEDVARQLSALGGSVGALLAALPVSTPSVALSGLTPRESVVRDADGSWTAVAGIEPLRIAVAPLALQDVVDPLVSGLREQVRALLDGSGDGLLAAALDDTLNVLLDQLESVPLGDGLAGLSTAGVDVSLLGATSTSTFTSMQAEAGDPTNATDPAAPTSPTAPTGPNDPASPPATGARTPPAAPVAAPATGTGRLTPANVTSPPRGASTLPRTGSEPAVVAAAALLAMAAGAHALRLGQRPA